MEKEKFVVHVKMGSGNALLSVPADVNEALACEAVVQQIRFSHNLLFFRSPQINRHADFLHAIALHDHAFYAHIVWGKGEESQQEIWIDLYRASGREFDDL